MLAFLYNAHLILVLKSSINSAMRIILSMQGCFLRYSVENVGFYLQILGPLAVGYLTYNWQPHHLNFLSLNFYLFLGLI